MGNAARENTGSSWRWAVGVQRPRAVFLRLAEGEERYTRNAPAGMWLTPPPGQAPRYLKPTNDAVFKQLFGRAEYPELLAFVLETLGVVAAPVGALQFMNPASGGEEASAKVAVVDASVLQSDGSEIVVEMQNFGSRTFRQRIVFYIARRHSLRVKKAQPYEAVRSTRLLAFLGYDEFPEDGRVLRCFQLRDVETGELFDDSLTVYVCELGKYLRHRKAGDGHTIEEFSSNVASVLSFLSAEDEATFEAAAAQHPILMNAARSLQSISMDHELRERAFMAACDAANAKHEREQDIAEAEQRGEARGEARGRREERARTARALLALGHAREQVEAVIGVSLASLGL